MLKLHEPELLNASNSAEIFNLLSTLPGKVTDVDTLFEVMEDVAGNVTDVIIEDNRRRQVAFLLSEQGSWRGELDRHIKGSRTRLTRRTLKRSKSVMDMLLFSNKGKKNYINNLLFIKCILTSFRAR